MFINLMNGNDMHDIDDQTNHESPFFSFLCAPLKGVKFPKNEI